MGARRRRGKVELAIMRGLGEIAELPAGLSGLRESALTLARTLDEGAGLATAAVARELRATMTELAKGVSRDDGPDPFDQEIAAFSRPVPASVEYRAERS